MTNQQPIRFSNVIMFEIDEKAVSDAVSIDQKPKEIPFPSPSPPPTKPVEPVSPSLPKVTVAPAPPVAATPPTWSSTPALPSDDENLPLAAIAGGLFAAFAAGTFLMRGRGDDEKSSVSAPAATASAPPPVPGVSVPAPSLLASSDVSIPYDAVARLSYDEWRATHNKGGFDEAKFQKFKANYDAITSANMAAKKKARDSGISPKLQSLSASADE